jgi:hypothetical protein
MLFLCLLGEYLRKPLIKAIKQIISSTGNWYDRHRHMPLGLDFWMAQDGLRRLYVCTAHDGRTRWTTAWSSSNI